MFEFEDEDEDDAIDRFIDCERRLRESARSQQHSPELGAFLDLLDKRDELEMLGASGEELGRVYAAIRMHRAAKED
jgi:hypothetical protein